jgi:hypothetical protein
MLPSALFPWRGLLQILGINDEKKLRQGLVELIHEEIGWSMGINQIHVGLRSKFGFVPFQPNEA